jgi:hypothetical protein
MWQDGGTADSHDCIANELVRENEVFNPSDELTLIMIYLLPKHVPFCTESVDHGLLGSLSPAPRNVR